MAFIRHPKSNAELDAILTGKPDNLAVIDFWASWCAPCHAIAPFYETLSNDLRHVTFLKVDTDASQDIARRYGITAMPTFKLIKNNNVIDTIIGADPAQLVTKIRAHAGSAPAAASTSGASTSSGSAQKADAITNNDVSLLEYLDPTQVNCLNESDENGIKSIVATKSKNTGPSYLLSDTDEQLLINIYFVQTVRIRSIAIQTKDAKSGPKDIKLFINKPTIGFEDVEDAKEPEASQVLSLTEANVKDGEHVPVRFVRFQSVNSLHIFVSSNHGGEDETRIDAIDIFGLPVQVTRDLSGLSQAKKDLED